MDLKKISIFFSSISWLNNLQTCKLLVKLTNFTFGQVETSNFQKPKTPESTNVLVLLSKQFKLLKFPVSLTSFSFHCKPQKLKVNRKNPTRDFRSKTSKTSKFIKLRSSFHKLLQLFNQLHAELITQLLIIKKLKLR